MNLDLFTYSALSSKARASYGRLLTAEDYNMLIDMKNVNEIAGYLKKNTYYSEILSNVDEALIHRGQLENIIKTDIMKEYDKFLRFTSGNARKFLQSTYKKYETESLKIIFRRLETVGGVMSAEGYLLFLKNTSEIDFHKLIKSKDSLEFIENLKGTEYYDVLRPFTGTGVKINLFNLEMVLDLHYFKFLYKRMKKYLTGKDFMPLEESFGVKTDVLNMLWIYRCKKYYNMKKEIIRSYILPFNAGIRKETLNRLIEAEDIEEFLEIAGTTKYSSIFIRDIDGFFEVNFADYMYNIHMKLFRKYPLSVTAAVDYIHMKEYELSNIISIIEGIRYGLPAEKIRKFVVGFDLRGV
ncbi:MAG TPA: V-type ATPase subunit [Clostridia bacterium]|nr:V-type ATPase subunit [Clostridia bacterium]HPQ46983.1 V-type ATPase subunit [Clostridia bacterium]